MLRCKERPGAPVVLHFGRKELFCDEKWRCNVCKVIEKSNFKRRDLRETVVLRKLNPIKRGTQLGPNAVGNKTQNGYSVRKYRYYFLSRKSILYIRYHEGKNTRTLINTHTLRLVFFFDPKFGTGNLQPPHRQSSFMSHRDVNKGPFF